jgi:Fe2+ or Zn2+ uptake regulation protein
VKNETDFQFHPTRPDLLLNALAEAGYSDTASRRAVVDVLCSSRTGVTPSDLVTRGRRSHAHLGQVTVYRTLEILEHLGLVRKLHQEDGCSSWVVTSATHGHHVICRSCGTAVEFEGCSIDAVLKRVSQSTGFSIEGHWLEMFGKCPACRSRA